MHSLEDLVHDSEAIFVGTVRRGQSELIENGTGIMTRYSLDVQRVVKGSLHSGQIVYFLIPGGKINFYDGSVAIEIMEKYPSLFKNRCYLIFAVLDDQQEKGFHSTAADQGVFEFLSDGRSVKPHAYYSWDPARSAMELTQDQLLQQIQRITQTPAR